MAQTKQEWTSSLPVCGPNWFVLPSQRQNSNDIQVAVSIAVKFEAGCRQRS
jgi:hypothetical protein